MIRISKQEWRNNPDNGFIRYVIFDDEGASVILEIYDKLFNPKSEESIKYAKVCAEDLADALRDAEQYEPIK